MKKITKKTKKTNMTEESDSSDSNPGFLSQNYTDSSDDVATRDANVVPTDEHAQSFFCKGKYNEDNESDGWVYNA